MALAILRGSDYTLVMYYVYVLENQNDKSLYIGFTENLKQRISDHQNGKGGSGRKYLMKQLFHYLN